MNPVLGEKGYKKRSSAFSSMLKGELSEIHSRYGLKDKVSQAIRKTQSRYIKQQHEDGYWCFELESNVTMSSEYLMLFHFLGLHDEDRDKKITNHILKHQRADGTWAIHRGGKGDLSTTVEAYFALKLAGLSPDDPRLSKAREFILSEGGVEASRVFTKIFLALFGEFDWKAVPSIPVEMMFLPKWFPFNIYSLSSWARTTLVPLSIVRELQPVSEIPNKARIQELYRDPSRKCPPLTSKKIPLLSWERLFLVLDGLIKLMGHARLRPLRGRGVRKALRWVLEHQEQSGDWAGIQPPMVYSIIVLSSLGHDLSYEPIRKGLEALERFTIEGESELVLQSCVSPVWDTAFTSLALLYSGAHKDTPSIKRAVQWLVGKQVLRKGDWSVKRPNLEPGGWSFEFENTWYPDVDDTAVVLMLLNRYIDGESVEPEKLHKALMWLLGMQGKDGGWGAFDVDNDFKIWNRTPVGDLEAMTDPSTADIAGRVLEVLGMLGFGMSDPAVRRAIGFLRRDQEDDGCWWARWGVNYIYGSWSVLVGLRSVGEDMNEPYVRKAVSWLKNRQNRDGGWGECCESYENPNLRGLGPSTASQTAWAILGLIAAGEAKSEEVQKGITFLVDTQRADGQWDEEEFTGTGFPGHFMIRYHNYRNCFPLMALGKFHSQSLV
jgi:squalene-hopene/tetraprenyl-beta-curcumene cyclase